MRPTVDHERDRNVGTSFLLGNSSIPGERDEEAALGDTGQPRLRHAAGNTLPTHERTADTLLQMPIGRTENSLMFKIASRRNFLSSWWRRWGTVTLVTLCTQDVGKVYRKVLLGTWRETWASHFHSSLPSALGRSLKWVISGIRN